MTLVYDKLPSDVEGPAHTTAEVDAWQKEHEPIVTIKVWLGKAEDPSQGAALTRVVWCEEIQAVTNNLMKPLEEMAGAMKAVHGMVHQVESALVGAAMLRGAMDSGTKH